MYRQEYEQYLEKIKTGIEFLEDYKNIQLCEKHLCEFSHEEALVFLQSMISEYKAEINIFGYLFNGEIVKENVILDTISSEEIMRQLTYLAKHIPIYALIRKGEEELAKKLFDWIQDKRC